MLLEHSLGRRDLARVVESAVTATLREAADAGRRRHAPPPREFTAAVLRNLSWLRWAQSPEDEETASYEWGV